MKKFLIRLLAIALCCVFALFLVELYLLRIPNRYSYKREYIENHINDIRVLVLGNSFMEDGIVPQELGDHSFNAAISGREPVYDFELGKRYIPQMTHLEAVVMPLDYRAFAFGRERVNPRDFKKHGGSESTFKCMNYKYLQVHVDPFWYWSEILNSELNYKSRIWMPYAQQIESDTLGSVRLQDANKNPKWEHWDLPRLYDTSVPKNQQEFDAFREGYRALAKVAHDRGCRLILLSTPKYKTYQADVNPEVKEEMRQFVADLRKDYPDVEYYDFELDTSFLPEDFHDAGHMSEAGAVKFSRMLRKIID